MRESSETSLHYLPRLGYAARGIVYMIVGGFAVLAALGQGRETPDTHGALQKILQQPLGDVMLGVVAAGLIAFAVWRLAQSLLDADRHGTSGRALVIRAGLFVSAVVSGALAVFALSLLFSWGGDRGSPQDWTAWLMAQPSGRWMVGAVGLLVVGTGLAVAYKGYRADFAKRFDMDRSDLRWAVPISRLGLIARGVVFVITGGFLIFAAIRANADEAQGLGGVFEWVQAQPFGSWLFALVALGLFAFGVYSIIESVYRRIACSLSFAPTSHLTNAPANRTA